MSKTLLETRQIVEKVSIELFGKIYAVDFLTVRSLKVCHSKGVHKVRVGNSSNRIFANNHLKLQELIDDFPKLKAVKEYDGLHVKFVEWITGTSFWLLCRTNPTASYFYKFGQLFKKYENSGVYIKDPIFQNFIYTPDDRIVVVDGEAVTTRVIDHLLKITKRLGKWNGVFLDGYREFKS
jgi:hypothetical protein